MGIKFILFQIFFYISNISFAHQLIQFYDIKKTFEENIKHPISFEFNKIDFKRKEKKELINFLGHKINSPIGIPACAIMIGKNIQILSKLGFDVFTYKTIRSKAQNGNPLPNILFVDGKNQISYDQIGKKIKSHNINFKNTIAIANSFGNNSLEIEFIKRDIKIAKESLHEGQILIVSVFGETKKEFLEAAKIAESSGADIIELNFSCPNVLSCDKPIYLNPKLVFNISKFIFNNINKPIIIKVGVFTDKNLMKEVYIKAHEAGIKAICGINSVPMKIVDDNGDLVFKDCRIFAGVSGEPIKNLALDFIKSAKKIINEENLDLKIVGIGGITKGEDFNLYLSEGADLALSACGTMFNPYLAIEYHKKFN